MAQTTMPKDFKYRFMYSRLKKAYGPARSADVMASAQRIYADMADLCTGASEGEWMHLNNTILPTSALYKAVQAVDAEGALTFTRNALMDLCRSGGRVMGVLMHVPGMKALFMRLMPRMALRMFGPACGFDYTGYEADSRHLKMDMTRCPYVRYAALLGVEELQPLFCESDVATYGDLPGIRFLRTKTLGTGGDKCDFLFERE